MEHVNSIQTSNSQDEFSSGRLLSTSLNHTILDPFLVPQLKYFSSAALLTAQLMRPLIPYYQPLFLPNYLPLLENLNNVLLTPDLPEASMNVNDMESSKTKHSSNNLQPQT